MLPRINARSKAVVSLIEPSISLQFLQRLAGLLLRRQGKNQTAVAYGMACSRMSNSSAVTEVAVLLYPLCERGQKNKTNNESLKGPRSLTASEISQTLKLKKETFRKSTAPVIYKHNGDRELLVGAGAEGRSKTTSDLSVHMHTHTHTQTHTQIHPAHLRNTLANRQRHTRTPKRRIRSQTQMSAFTFIRTSTKYRLVGFVVKIS